MTQQHSRLTLEATEGAHGEVAQRIALELMEWAEQRTELVEALKLLLEDADSTCETYDIAKAAITKAEATK